MLQINIKADHINKTTNPARVIRAIFAAVLLSVGTLALTTGCANPMQMTVISETVTGNERVNNALNSAVALYKQWDQAGKQEGSALLTQAKNLIDTAFDLTKEWETRTDFAPESKDQLLKQFADIRMMKGLIYYGLKDYAEAKIAFDAYLGSSRVANFPAKEINGKTTATMMKAWVEYKQKNYFPAVTLIKSAVTLAQDLNINNPQELQTKTDTLHSEQVITSGYSAFGTDTVVTKNSDYGITVAYSSSTEDNPAGVVVFMDALDYYNSGATTFTLTITNSSTIHPINGLTIGLIDAVARAEYEKPVAQQDADLIKAHTKAISVSTVIAPGASINQVVDRNAPQSDANVVLNNIATSSVAGDMLTFTPSTSGAYAAISLNEDWSPKIVAQNAAMSFNLANFSAAALSGLSIVLSDANDQSLTFTPASATNLYAHGKTLANGINNLTMADFYQVVKPYGTATIQQQSATSVAIANMDTTVRMDLPIAAQSPVDMTSTFAFDISNITGSLTEMKVILLNAAGDSLVFKAARTLASYCPGTHASIPMSDLFVNVGGVKTAANATNLAAFGSVTAVVLTNTNAANPKSATLSGISLAGQSDLVLFPFDFTQVKTAGIYVKDGTASNVGFGSVVLDGTAVHINSDGADFQGPAAAYSVSTQTTVPVQIDISNDHRQQW